MALDELRAKRWVWLLLLVAWAYSVVPNLLNAPARQGSRVVVTEAFVSTPLASLSRTAFFLLFLILVTLLVMPRIVRMPDWALILVLPTLAAIVSAVANSQSIGVGMAVLPVTAVVLSVLQPSVASLRVIGGLTLMTVVISVLMALFTQYGFFGAGTQADAAAPGGTKALYFERLLSGPYEHSNTLGMALALGLPFVLMLEQKWLRRFGVIALLLCLLATSARTSLFGAGIGLVAFTVLSASKGGTRLGIMRIGPLALLFAGLFLPLTVKDPQAFTGRGQIWIASVEAWRGSPVVGLGSEFFARIAATVNRFGVWAFNSHNLVLHQLVVTGSFGLGAWLVLMMVLAQAVIRCESEFQASTFSFLCIYLTICILEVPGGFADLGQLGYVTWLPMFVIICSGLAGRSHHSLELSGRN